MTVIDFQKEVEKIEPMIWKCNCGNCAFLLYINGMIECSDCGTCQNGLTEHYQVVRKWTRKKEGK